MRKVPFRIDLAIYIMRTCGAAGARHIRIQCREPETPISSASLTSITQRVLVGLQFERPQAVVRSRQLQARISTPEACEPYCTTLRNSNVVEACTYIFKSLSCVGDMLMDERMVV
jgi:hypothetical protein